MLNKITENVEIHQTLPDTPNLTSEELKKKWDEGNKIIKEHFNQTIDELDNAEVLELKEKIIGTVLYEDETGTTGNVTLSDSVANYDYIEIQCKRNVGNEDVLYGTGRLYKPNGKTVSISATYTDSANVYVYSKMITINGNNINVIRANLAIINNACTISSDDSNFITRVVGYKVS